MTALEADQILALGEFLLPDLLVVVVRRGGEQRQRMPYFFSIVVVGAPAAWHLQPVHGIARCSLCPFLYHLL